MIYLKSALAGIITAVLASAVYAAIVYTYVQVRLRILAAQSPTDTYFVVAHWHPLALQSVITMTALFLAGAYWMFRRLRLQQAI